jgi:hypothetical protein
MFLGNYFAKDKTDEFQVSPFGGSPNFSSSISDGQFPVSDGQLLTTTSM